MTAVSFMKKQAEIHAENLANNLVEQLREVCHEWAHSDAELGIAQMHNIIFSAMLMAVIKEVEGGAR